LQVSNLYTLRTRVSTPFQKKKPNRVDREGKVRVPDKGPRFRLLHNLYGIMGIDPNSCRFASATRDDDGSSGSDLVDASQVVGHESVLSWTSLFAGRCRGRCYDQTGVAMVLRPRGDP